MDTSEIDEEYLDQPNWSDWTWVEHILRSFNWKQSGRYLLNPGKTLTALVIFGWAAILYFSSCMFHEVLSFATPAGWYWLHLNFCFNFSDPSRLMLMKDVSFKRSYRRFRKSLRERNYPRTKVIKKSYQIRKFPRWHFTSDPKMKSVKSCFITPLFILSMVF